MLNTVEEALSFAIAKHGDQKYGDKPYSYHLKSVIEICNYLPVSIDKFKEELKIVAALHDVLEDTNVSRKELEDIFGEKISDAVWSLTRQENEIYSKYICKVKDNIHSRLVKKCDILSNLENCWKDKDQNKSLINRYIKALFLLG